MRTRLELIIEVEHPEDYDPADTFVYYFADSDGPFPKTFVVSESWTEV